MSNNNEMARWLLTPQQLSLGFCRDTFVRGSVIIECDDYLVINGKKYTDTRDMDVLKRQRNNAVSSGKGEPWIIPYTEEDEKRLLGMEDARLQTVRPPTDHRMTVVASDQDLIDAIDISNTKVASNNAQQRRMDRNASKNYEIIRDDENVELKLKQLAGRTDAAAIAERIELKTKPQVLPVVRDDSLGAPFDSNKTPSLNAGAVIYAKKQVRNEPVKNETAENDDIKNADAPKQNIVPPQFIEIVNQIWDLVRRIDERMSALEVSVEETKKRVSESAPDQKCHCGHECHHDSVLMPVEPVEQTKPVEQTEPVEPAGPVEPAEPVVADVKSKGGKKRKSQKKNSEN